MYNDREISLFHDNANKCPCYSAGNHRVPVCTLQKSSHDMGMLGECGPGCCPIFYWLKVTGLLSKATVSMRLPQDPQPDGQEVPACSLG